MDLGEAAAMHKRSHDTSPTPAPLLFRSLTSVALRCKRNPFRILSGGSKRWGSRWGERSRSDVRMS